MGEKVKMSNQHNTLILSIITFIQIIQLSTCCITPENKQGDCISIQSCPKLLESFLSLNSTKVQFVLQSKCDSKNETFVCCENGKTVESSSRIDVNKTSLLPNPRICGLQHTDDRPYSDAIAAIDEFPWLALLRYRTNNGKDDGFKCMGTLISKRYVLTTAHCIKARSTRILYQVRLGEYNPQKDVDCAENPDYPECSDPVEDVDVEEAIPHPDYVGNIRNYNHDIGLVRLKKTIYFTDFIRPICLPLPGFKLAETNDFVLASGWSNPLDRENKLNRKKRSKLQLISNEECNRFYKKYQVRIFDTQMCATENDLESTCIGDSGGPIMFSNRYKWHQEGIVSFGPLICGNGTITVGIRIPDYIPWILDTMKP